MTIQPITPSIDFVNRLFLKLGVRKFTWCWSWSQKNEIRNKTNQKNLVNSLLARRQRLSNFGVSIMITAIPRVSLLKPPLTMRGSNVPLSNPWDRFTLKIFSSLLKILPQIFKMTPYFRWSRLIDWKLTLPYFPPIIDKLKPTHPSFPPHFLGEAPALWKFDSAQYAMIR